MENLSAELDKLITRVYNKKGALKHGMRGYPAFRLFEFL